jgi:hypothetical protein
MQSAGYNDLCINTIRNDRDNRQKAEADEKESYQTSCEKDVAWNKPITPIDSSKISKTFA